MSRKPAVAGQFYPASVAKLTDQVESFIDKTADKEDVLGVVAPHAGYVYSGPVAGAVFSRVIPKKNYIILGPNHTGYGSQFSVMAGGSWAMPNGDAKINEELAQKIISSSKAFEKDADAHVREHSIEVQLPFIQYLGKDFQFVPIVVSLAECSVLKKLGKAIAGAVKDIKDDLVIIASSDMTHYESQKEAMAKDQKAIDAMLALDIDGLLGQVSKYDISMCGCAPAAVMISAVKELGATRAELVKYQTSGDTSGDYSAVVGYAGMIFS